MNVCFLQTIEQIINNSGVSLKEISISLTGVSVIPWWQLHYWPLSLLTVSTKYRRFFEWYCKRRSNNKRWPYIPGEFLYLPLNLGPYIFHGHSFPQIKIRSFALYVIPFTFYQQQNISYHWWAWIPFRSVTCCGTTLKILVKWTNEIGQ